MYQTSKQHNIMILEDDRVVAERLRQNLLNWSHGRTLPICGTVQQGVALIRRDKIDVLIADLNLPDGIGITVIEELKSAQPDAQVIVMTVLDDSHVVLEAIRAGATGYILKEDTNLELIPAIEMALCNRSPMSASIARLIVESLQLEQRKSQPAATSDDEEVPELTARESDVLTQISRGFSHKEVAEKLDISVNTVPVHTRNIYRKLQARNKTQALSRAKDFGLI